MVALLFETEEYMTTETEPVRTHRGLSLRRQEVPDINKLGYEFDEHMVEIADLQVEMTDDYNDLKSPGHRDNLNATHLILPNGDDVPTSSRFWTSLAAKAGFSSNIFSLFDHEEVFSRIKDRGKLSSTVRIVEQKQNGRRKLLSVSDPKKSFCRFEDMKDLLKDRDGSDIQYADGILRSSHSTPNDHILDVADEEYRPRIHVEIPIDGYGNVNTYLGLLRVVCTNGSVAMSKAFKTQLKQQKNDNSMEDALHRMFDSYSNDEGMDALIQRMTAARHSALSVNEALTFYKDLIPMLSVFQDNAERTKESMNAADTIRQRFGLLIGDLHSKYGQSNLESMSARQRKSLPADCRVYDMFQFITELTSHVFTRGKEEDTMKAKKLHGLVGSMISKEYDFEQMLPDGMTVTAEDPVPDFYFTQN